MAFLKPFCRGLLGVFFIAAGLNHFWHTDFYLSIMPPYLPWPLALVQASGAAEIALGALLLLRRWQGVAGWGLAGLCMAVFPANLHMALHPELFTQFTPAGLWLPLQLVLIGWALACTHPPASMAKAS
ncbi:MAG: conserved rane protein of unknown function [Polaromonas sp.]|nr:conserved rane protein of unknown function [Polaromonas sp.]